MERRDELRDKALDYFLTHGLADLSLRPLAEEIGTSARLLIYHFESKESLIATVMGHARELMQNSLAEMMRSNRGEASIESFWNWMTEDQNIRHARLLFEVQALAMQKPETYAQYLSKTSSSWLDIIEQGIPKSANRRVVATLCGAVMDGLALEYMATGDLDRTTASLKLFVSMLGSHRGKKAR
jgi:AcrR family transcriptional regulator